MGYGYTDDGYNIRLDSKEFMECVNYLVNAYNIENIVETGTFDGTGSTKILAQTKKPVFTIECNDALVIRARNNLGLNKNVIVFHGYSLPWQLMVDYLISYDAREFEGKCRTDVDEYAQIFYLRELIYNSSPLIKSDLLRVLTNNDRTQLVFLDSAGGIGELEVDYFLDNLSAENKANKILILDDIQHVKHYNSVNKLKASGYTWVDCGRFGYSVLDTKLP